MMTQQSIVDRLNQLTLRYNLTWFDIKYDADKAIAKINNFLGATYPKMSDILISSEHTYTLRVKGIDVEIFPEAYIHSVVIPYIATEVLARDEEFTTVYNKYLMELDDGLFNMFQNEFNNVPKVFRQRQDVGVFFPSDTPVGAKQAASVPNTFKAEYRVYYNINNSNILLDSLPVDTALYDYGSTATVLDYFTADNDIFISTDGVVVYEFLGWAYNAEANPSAVLLSNAEIKIVGDVQLYAIWSKTYTINVTTAGAISVKDAYKSLITNLELPDVLHGIYLRTIPEEFCTGMDQLNRIVLPKYITNIKEAAFSGFKGNSIIFQKRILSLNDTGITIETQAFEETTNLVELFLPYAVRVIQEDAFPAVANKPLMIIRCEVLSVNTPETWAMDSEGLPTWYASTGYVVEWGYHG